MKPTKPSACFYDREAVMTFAEIARQLGVTPKAAEMTFRHALKKIRRRPESVRQFRALVELRTSLRDRGAAL